MRSAVRISTLRPIARLSQAGTGALPRTTGTPPRNHGRGRLLAVAAGVTTVAVLASSEASAAGDDDPPQSVAQLVYKVFGTATVKLMNQVDEIKARVGLGSRKQQPDSAADTEASKSLREKAMRDADAHIARLHAQKQAIADAKAKDQAAAKAQLEAAEAREAAAAKEAAQQDLAAKAAAKAAAKQEEDDVLISAESTAKALAAREETARAASAAAKAAAIQDMQAAAAQATEAEPAKPLQEPAAPKGPRQVMSSYAAEAMAEVLRADGAEASKGSTLAAMSADELRSRVQRLEAELRERAREEALRLSDFSRAYDARWEQQADDLAAKRVADVRAEAEMAVEEARRMAIEEAKAAVEEAKAELRAELRRKVESAEARAVSQVAQQRERESAERLAEQVALRKEAAAAREGQGWHGRYERASARVHRASLAVMDLFQSLDSAAGRANRPGYTRDVTREVEALRVAGAGDEVLGLAADGMPATSYKRAGIPSHEALAARMVDVSRAVRTAALSPAGAGIVGHALATAAGAVVSAFGTNALISSGDNSTNAAAVAPGSSAANQARSKAALAQLAAAEEALEGRDYAAAAASLAKLEGRPKTLAEGMRSDLAARAAAEQQLRLAKSHVATLVAAMY